jgi:tetratricopeptide (TPR) repeat protein
MKKKIILFLILIVCLSNFHSIAQTFGNEWINYNQTYFKFKVAKDSIELLSAHMDFIGQFQNSMVEMISNDIAAKDYNKDAGWVIKYYKITANPIGAKYMDGAAKYRNADKGGANALWKEAETMLKKITSLDEWTEADRTLLKIGVMEAAECYISSKQVEKAKETMNKVAPWFESDPDFKEKYDALIN